MYSQPEKSKSNQSGRAVVNDVFQRQTSSSSTLQFTDNRLETIAQKKRYQVVNGNGMQARFQSPISGPSVIHLPASSQVIQCLRLPRFKDENAAIIYFEDSLLDNLDGNYEKTVELDRVARTNGWHDLAERIHYYFEEKSKIYIRIRW